MFVLLSKALHSQQEIGRHQYWRRHDEESEPDLVSSDAKNPTNGVEDGADVTRAQDGQFSEETEGVLPLTWERPQGLLEGEMTEHVEGPSIAMERSGAQTIKGQRISLSNSGAQSIEARSARLENSGAAKLTTERATLNDSSVLIGSAKEMRFAQSKVLVANAGTSSLAAGNTVGVLATGNLEAEQDVKTVFLAAGSVKAGGSVSSVLTPATAAAMGGAFAIVFAVLSRLLRRRSA